MIARSLKDYKNRNMNLIQGNSKEVLKTLADNSVDSIVTDPPYELGFMGKAWDNSGIANDVELWAECLRVLKPGGHLLAFSGTRTYHRMAVAIEDAGFEIRDMVEWVYGAGFPKSHNIGKAVDKLRGNEREVIDTGETVPDIRANNYSNSEGKARLKANITKGTSEWEGWGTALKPAHEPICMARKPLAEKTVAANVLKWGTGGINVDGCRVGTEDNTDRIGGGKKGGKGCYGISDTYDSHTHPQGRFPANLIHDGSDEVKGCFPETKSSDSVRKNKAEAGNTFKYSNDFTTKGHSDQGNASRFFKSIIYQGKATKRERNRGCEHLPNGNNHPTVKPVALMEYLIVMVTPPGGTVLDPFMGSGSTGVAAKGRGFGFIGIDLGADHIEIAKARIAATPMALF